MDRRSFVASTTGFLTASAHAGPRILLESANGRLRAMRDSLGPGARLGVSAIDTVAGRQINFDARSRYAMCSTFKLPLAGMVLQLADRGYLSLSEELPFTHEDPLENSPMVEASLTRRRLSVGSLAAAALRQSDNSAANLLLRRIGGPEALTQFIRSCHDLVTRCDRYELSLNSNIDGDPRDTTTPAAMVGLTRALVFGPVLSPASRLRLANWMITSLAKPDRLKAGFPAEWRVGHKPGTGRGGAVNDVAIGWRPGRSPVVAAVYISGGTADVTLVRRRTVRLQRWSPDSLADQWGSLRSGSALSSGSCLDRDWVLGAAGGAGRIVSRPGSVR